MDLLPRCMHHDGASPFCLGVFPVPVSSPGLTTFSAVGLFDRHCVVGVDFRPVSVCDSSGHAVVSAIRYVPRVGCAGPHSRLSAADLTPARHLCGHALGAGASSRTHIEETAILPDALSSEVRNPACVAVYNEQRC